MAPASWWFRSAHWGVLMAAVGHTIGHFAGGSSDEKLQVLRQQMSDFKLPMPFGMQASMADAYNALSLSFSVWMLAWLISGWLIARHGDAALIRSSAIVGAAVSGVLAVLYWSYSLPPPALCFVLSLSLFVIAARRPVRGS
jgi:hypothetical protein